MGINYKIDVFGDDHPRTRHPAWINFLKEIKMQKYGHTGIMLGALDEWIWYRDRKLSDFKATYTEGHLWFNTEQDMMLFLLRWS